MPYERQTRGVVETHGQEFNEWRSQIGHQIVAQTPSDGEAQVEKTKDRPQKASRVGSDA